MLYLIKSGAMRFSYVASATHLLIIQKEGWVMNAYLKLGIGASIFFVFVGAALAVVGVVVADSVPLFIFGLLFAAIGIGAAIYARKELRREIADSLCMRNLAALPRVKNVRHSSTANGTVERRCLCFFNIYTVVCPKQVLDGIYPTTHFFYLLKF